jgi:hypothetical protein
MVKRSTAIIAVLGCAGHPAPKPNAITNAALSSTPVMIALGDDDRVRVVAVTPTETKTLRDVEVPSYLVDLQWVMPDPIVLLGRPNPDRCAMPESFYTTREEYLEAERACEFDPAYVGVIGRITQHGFVPYPKLPEATWAGLKQPDENSSLCEIDCWRLAIRDDKVFQGHCVAAFSADGREICDAWMYARIDVPGPAMAKLPESRPSTTTLQPDRLTPTGAPAPFEVNVSPLVKIEFVAQDEEARYGGKLTHLRCTQGSHTTIYPQDVKDLDLGMGEKVQWLTTDPPRFLASHGHDGMTPWNDKVLFEGCTPRVVGEIVPGPHATLLVGGMLLQRGQFLGEVPSAKLVDFAP